MPKDFYDSEYRNLDFYQLKNLTERTGVTPVFNLNILTSDKFYQSASLMFANSINLPVKYLEFGNELYNDLKVNETIFPTAEDYINTANDWADYIKSRPGFANYKIAVVNNINVVVYPNPNNGEFTINYDLTNFNRGSIVFFNVIGKKVWESELNVAADRSNLQIKDMTNGIYSYTVYGNNKPVTRGKITIIK